MSKLHLEQIIIFYSQHPAGNIEINTKRKSYTRQASRSSKVAYERLIHGESKIKAHSEQPVIHWKEKKLRPEGVCWNERKKKIKKAKRLRSLQTFIVECTFCKKVKLEEERSECYFYSTKVQNRKFVNSLYYKLWRNKIIS